MPACVLAKKGLTGAMEARRYFDAAGKTGEAASKQDRFKQRLKRTLKRSGR